VDVGHSTKIYRLPGCRSQEHNDRQAETEKQVQMQKQLMTVLMATSLTLLSLPAGAQGTNGRPEYWHHGWDSGWGWGHMVFGSLMMVVFWGGIIVAIVLAVRSFGGGTSHGTAPPASRNTAFDILKDRLARGEIENEEFEERERLLSD